MTKRETERQEAIQHLRELIKPGDKVYTVLRHVSRSGMTRGIDVYYVPRCNCKDCAACGGRTICAKCEMCTRCHSHKPGCDGCHAGQPEPIWITSYVGKAIDQPQPLDYWRKSLGLKIGGCGMDMGFHVVNSLQYVLFGVPTKDNPKPGELKHRWL